MKFTIDGYEIEIKAKREGAKRASKDDTMCFMNSLAIWMRESGKFTAFEHRNDSGFYDGNDDAIECGKRYGAYLKAAANDLHDQLDAYGCYDNI